MMKDHMETRAFGKTFERVLALLQQDERRNFMRACGLEPDAKTTDLEKALAGLPRYEVIRIFLSVAAPTLQMIMDVFRAMEQLGIAVRTTGCVFVLANAIGGHKMQKEIVFSPQSVGILSEWTSFSESAVRSTSFNELAERWKSFQDIWRRLIRRAEVNIERGELDIVESYINHENVYEDDMDCTDYKAQAVLKYILQKVERVHALIVEVQEEDLQDSLISLRYGMASFLGAARKTLAPKNGQQRRLRRRSYGKDEDEPPERVLVERYTTKQFPDEIDRFIEDAFLLGNISQRSPPQLADLLRLDLWSSRPQMYEIWLLLSILVWLLHKGYKVQLCKLDMDTADSATRWNLSFSREKDPCAVITRKVQQPQYLFYQVYRASGDMPDICLSSGIGEEFQAIWSLDAKHSERSGYSATDYRKTAERYRDSLGASLSVVAEYFDRSDIGQANPITYGHATALVRACRPGSPGRDVLFDLLSPFHPAVGGILVCIDFSESFCSQRSTIASEFREWCMRGNVTCLDRFVSFANKAEVYEGFNQWLQNPEAALPACSVGSGTYAAPLIEIVRQEVRNAQVSSIMLLTDGQFDMSIGEIVSHLEAEHGRRVFLFNDLSHRNQARSLG